MTHGPTDSDRARQAMEVVRDLRRRADGGDRRARFMLGWALMRENQYSEALKYLEPAAKDGEPGAQAELARALFNGSGVPKDNAAAVQWARRAAVQGDGDGATYLARALEHGHGVREDRVEALAWYLLAASMRKATKERIVDLRAKMPEGDQARASARVFELKSTVAALRGLPIARPMRDVYAASRAQTRVVRQVPGDPGQDFGTKFGGAPWWPAGMERPTCEQHHPLAFMCQILLSDVPGFDAQDRTLLVFHYCTECQSWGYPEPAHGAYDIRLFKTDGTPDGLGITSPGPLPAGKVELVSRPDTIDQFDAPELPSGMHPADLAHGNMIDPETFGAPPAKNTNPSAGLPHEDGTKLGGWPSWVQAPDWPTCSHGHRMRFVAQIDATMGEDTTWGGGGYAYIFVCPQGCPQRHGELVIETT